MAESQGDSGELMPAGGRGQRGLTGYDDLLNLDSIPLKLEVSGEPPGNKSEIKFSTTIKGSYGYMKFKVRYDLREPHDTAKPKFQFVWDPQGDETSQDTVAMFIDHYPEIGVQVGGIQAHRAVLKSVDGGTEYRAEKSVGEEKDFVVEGYKNAAAFLVPKLEFDSGRESEWAQIERYAAVRDAGTNLPEKPEDLLDGIKASILRDVFNIRLGGTVQEQLAYFSKQTGLPNIREKPLRRLKN